MRLVFGTNDISGFCLPEFVNMDIFKQILKFQLCLLLYPLTPCVSLLSQAIRKVFASSFLEELKVSLLSILEDDVPLFGDIDLCIGTTASFRPTMEDVVYTDRLKLEIGASMDTNCSIKQKDSSWSEAPLTDFDQFIGLLKLLAFLPRGYLFASDVARCAYTVSQLERSVTQQLS